MSAACKHPSAASRTRAALLAAFYVPAVPCCPARTCAGAAGRDSRQGSMIPRVPPARRTRIKPHVAGVSARHPAPKFARAGTVPALWLDNGVGRRSGLHRGRLQGSSSPAGSLGCEAQELCANSGRPAGLARGEELLPKHTPETMQSIRTPDDPISAPASFPCGH